MGAIATGRLLAFPKLWGDVLNEPRVQSSRIRLGSGDPGAAGTVRGDPRNPHDRTAGQFTPAPARAPARGAGRDARRRRAAHAQRVSPATVDLFPYDLAASIVGCVVTIMAYISFGRPVAIALTVALAAGGEAACRLRWFPSLGVNLIIGTLAGVLFVITA